MGKKEKQSSCSCSCGKQLAALKKEVKDMEYRTVALLGRVADMEKHKVAVVDKVLRALYQKEGEE